MSVIVAEGFPKVLHHDPLRPFTLVCPQCGAGLDDIPSLTLAYCSGQKIVCCKCGTKFDCWKTLLGFITQNFMGTQVFALAGAMECWFQVRLTRGNRFTLRLADLGIPKDARVVSMNLTPAQVPGHEGALHGLLTHGNVLNRASRLGAAEFDLFPMPLGGNPEVGDLAGLVTWVDGTLVGERSSLVDALEAYTAGAFDEMIVPANVAMELAVERIAEQYLTGIASRDNIDGFLDVVTYGHRMNVLIPLVARERKVPSLPDHARGVLNRLRGLRNDVAHSGRPRKPLDRESAAEILAALVTGLGHVALLTRSQA